MRGGKESGFTLLEVMVALGILAIAYVGLLETQSSSMRLSTYGKQITIATFLAQYKMELTEDKLTREGFPDSDQEDDGTFEEQGYPGFKWKVDVKKVELPLGDALSYLLSNQLGGSDQKDSSAKSGDQASGLPDLSKLGDLGALSGMSDKLQGPFGDMLKSKLGGGTGGLSGAAKMLMNPDMLKGNIDMLSKMLEQALRLVQLTVSWEGGGPGKELVVTTHLVQVPQAAGAAGANPTAGSQTNTSLTGNPITATNPSTTSNPSTTNKNLSGTK